MCADYSDIFKSHEQKRRDAETKTKAANDDRRRWREQAAAHLAEHVAPAFSEALAAIKAQGYVASVSSAGAQSGQPHMELSFTPKREGETHSYAMPSTISVGAASAGKMVVVRKVSSKTAEHSYVGGSAIPSGDIDLEKATTAWVAALLRRFVADVLTAQGV